MKEISEIDAPKLWKIESRGGVHDYGSIKDWFLFPFDCYFIYQHPIVIDLDYLVEEKYWPKKPPYCTNLEQMTCKDFIKTYFPQHAGKYIWFDDFWEVYYRENGKGIDFLYEQLRGSYVKINDIKIILDILNPEKKSNIFIHYDILRSQLMDKDMLDFYYECTIDEFLSKETLSNYSPEDILDSKKDWCITTSYDACFSVIACNDKFADRFRGQQNNEIYELFL